MDLMGVKPNVNSVCDWFLSYTEALEILLLNDCCLRKLLTWLVQLNVLQRSMMKLASFKLRRASVDEVEVARFNSWLAQKKVEDRVVEDRNELAEELCKLENGS